MGEVCSGKRVWMVDMFEGKREKGRWFFAFFSCSTNTLKVIGLSRVKLVSDQKLALLYQ